MKLIELFEMTFVDGTKLWAIGELNENNHVLTDRITFGILGIGIAKTIRGKLEEDLKNCCAIASELAETEIVTSFKEA